MKIGNCFKFKKDDLGLVGMTKQFALALCIATMALILVLWRKPVMAQAQSDCDVILRGGVFNVTTVNKGLHIQDDLFSWLSIATDEQFMSAQKAGLTFSATIDGIPFNLNGSDSLSQFHRLQTSINQGQITHFTQDEFLQTVQLSVSPEIVNAWVKCVTQPSIGLSCSVSANGDHAFTFFARWLPNSITDYPPTVLSAGFQVSPGATFTGLGFPDGSEIQIAGSSLILNRPGSDAVIIILNTSKGSCQESIPALSPPPPPVVQLPPLSVKLFAATGTAANHPQVQVTVPNGYKIISGGGYDETNGYGNYLTCSMPTDVQHWIAKGKDHEIPDPSQINGYALALYDPNDQWEVVYQTSTVGPAEHPAGVASLPSGFTLTGGGACANWVTSGLLLTASYPQDSTSWFAEAKDHYVPESATLTIVVIGIRARNGIPLPDTRIFSTTSTVAERPSATVTVDSSYIMLGGGCQVHWTEPGNLLFSCFSPNVTSWTGSSKDHDVVSPASISVYAIGIILPPAVSCAYAFSPNTLLLPAQGSTVTVNLTTSPGCTWGVDSAPPWVKVVSAGPLTSSGTITLAFQSNLSGGQRVGTIAAGGQILTVIQDGLTCGQPQLSLTSLSFPSAGGRGSIDVTGLQDGCPYTVSDVPGWITPVTGATGVIPGTFIFQVAPLQGASRSAAINVAGITVSVAQSGSNQPDFTLGTAPGASSSATISSGDSFTTSMILTPIFGLTGPVSAACTGAPIGATCTVSPVTQTVTGTLPLPIAINVTTTRRSLVPPTGLPDTEPHLHPLGVLLVLVLLASVLAIRRFTVVHKPKLIGACLATGLALAYILTMMAGCGRNTIGSKLSPTTPTTGSTTGTPAGSYALTVTVTSGALAHSSTVILTVK